MEDKTKLAEALKSVWNSLTDEQKAKAAKLKTPEEFMKFAGEECIELPDELLEAVSGGYIHYDERSDLWSVIRDSDGKELDWYYFRDDAEDAARNLGVSHEEISDGKLSELRGGC